MQKYSQSLMHYVLLYCMLIVSACTVARVNSQTKSSSLNNKTNNILQPECVVRVISEYGDGKAPGILICKSITLNPSYQETFLGSQVNVNQEEANVISVAFLSEIKQLEALPDSIKRKKGVSFTVNISTEDNSDYTYRIANVELVTKMLNGVKIYINSHRADIRFEVRKILITTIEYNTLWMNNGTRR